MINDESKKDLVSIIIPIHNSEKFLQDCIDSIVNQTYKNIEIIAIDDGSSDNSLKILKQNSEKIKIIYHQNIGLAATLNVGVNKMKGKWFKWFSPDDLMYDDTIEILVNVGSKLEENTIIYSNWDIIDTFGNKIRSFTESNYNDLTKFDFNIRLLDNQQINVNTSLIPANLFKKGCNFISVENQATVDYDFFLRSAILFQTKFFLIEKPMIKYRIHSDQLSHKSIMNNLDYMQKIRKKVLSCITEELKTKYMDSLHEYQKIKPISQKSLETSLKVISKILPKSLTAMLLLFYLNKIRTKR
ncbi:MAG: glycosyltransferase [Nitrosopumilus sp.]|nr:glycosyltransferase [Nitrosopumilus sp.]